MTKNARVNSWLSNTAPGREVIQGYTGKLSRSTNRPKKKKAACVSANIVKKKKIG
jgi:hypothetical protein